MIILFLGWAIVGAVSGFLLAGVIIPIYILARLGWFLLLQKIFLDMIKWKHEFLKKQNV